MNEQQRIPTGSQLQQDLVDSLDVLRTRGWCQGELIDGEGRVCLVGALSAAIFGGPRTYWASCTADDRARFTRYRVAATALAHALPPNHQAESLTSYNDRRVRTVRPILALYRRAIAATTPKGPR